MIFRSYKALSAPRMRPDPEMMPKIFGWQHITYLCVFFALLAAAVLLIAYKVKKQKSYEIIIRSCGVVLIALILWSRIAWARWVRNPVAFIPDSFCSVTSFALGFVALLCKRNVLPLHCLWYIAFLGGIVNMIYPYYITRDPHFFGSSTLSGMMHHSMALSLSIFMIMKGWFKPSVKKFYAFPVGLCFFLVYGIFLVDALGIHNIGKLGFITAMNIYSELVPGVKLFAWYYVLPVLCAALFGLVCLYEYVAKRIAAKKSATDEHNMISEAESPNK